MKKFLNRIIKFHHLLLLCLLLMTGSIHSSISYVPNRPFQLNNKQILNASLSLSHTTFDIPVQLNEETLKWVRFFTSKEGSKQFRKYSMRAGKYAPLIRKILRDQGLPEDLFFLAMAESGLQVRATSSAQAVGPWQFMEQTAKQYGLKVNWFIDERKDPIKSTIAASFYLKKLYAEFSSWPLAFAAYNAGERKIWESIKDEMSFDFWILVENLSLPKETREHIPKIYAMAIIGKNLEQFKFRDLNFERPLDFEEVEVQGGVDLKSYADFIDVNYSEIKGLNPELRRWFTPIDENSYLLKVPLGAKRNFELKCKKDQRYLKEFSKNSVFKLFKKLIIPKDGFTLYEISENLSISTEILVKINKIPLDKKLKRGDIVLLPLRKS